MATNFEALSATLENRQPKHGHEFINFKTPEFPEATAFVIAISE